MARRIQVLIVEDCEEDAALEVRALRKHGFEPEHERVCTPEGLAAALARGGWDIILSDYRMPGFSGLDALRLARERSPEAPFILISGSMGEDLAVESLKAGAADYVLKDRPARLGPAVERALRERAAQAEKTFLERQLAQAQKMEAIGRLTGGVAHDFNNLLTAISGFSGFLLESLPQGDPRREDVMEIQRAGERAAALTRQLLAFSRLRDVAPRVMDLNDAVRDVEKLLRRVIGEDVALETALMAGAAPILADSTQIHQILLNLAVNARDAMPDGGCLRIATRPALLDQAAAAARPDARPGPYLVLEVSDTGMGMDQAVISHLFEAFFTTKPEGKGTGLGLSTVYGIVRQCGGFIAVESLPEKGSKFAVHLPLAGLETAEEKPAPGADLPQARGEAVLVADDDEFVRRFAVRALKSLGYRVFDSGLPEEALQLGAKEDVQLLLSDLVMPGMTGLELARRLAKHKPRVRALFMSGFSIESRIADGALDEETLLRKPLSIESLAEAVRRALDRP